MTADRRQPAAACRAFIGLGANLGEPAQALAAACQAIAALPDSCWLRASSCYRSAPVGGGGPDYLNQVAEIRTALAPHDLLQALNRIEAASGRQRGERNAPRTLDLDLLLYGDAADSDCPPRMDSADPTLVLPHPRMHLRVFVLMPLCELAATVQIPGQGEVGALLAQLLASPAGREQRCERI